MPRFGLFLDDPYLGVRSAAAHFIPWVSCMGSSGFWTLSQRNRFTVNVFGHCSGTIEVVRHTGSTRRVAKWEWRRCLADYIEKPSGIGFGHVSRVNSLTTYCTPMFTAFFAHLFNGECFCLTQDTGVGPPPKAKESATNAWDA